MLKDIRESVDRVGAEFATSEAQRLELNSMEAREETLSKQWQEETNTLNEMQIATTLNEFVAWNQDATGVSVSVPVDATIDGYPAVYVDVGGTDDCPNGKFPVDCSCVEPTGLTDVDGTLVERTWAVEVNGQIVIVLFNDGYAPLEPLTPERVAIVQEFIDSIQFE